MRVSLAQTVLHHRPSYKGGWGRGYVAKDETHICHDQNCALVGEGEVGTDDGSELHVLPHQPHREG